MPVTYINRRCTCGFTNFSDRRASTATAIDRWVRFDASGQGGFGSTPFGTAFGAGLSELWGIFTSTFRNTVLEVRCLSCGRLRSQSRLGGIAVFGSYTKEGFIYVVASDVGTPATCFSIRFTGSVTYEFPLIQRIGILPDPLVLDAPSEFAVLPPDGADLADDLLYATLPEVDVTEEFVMELIDRCAGTTTSLGTILLEAEPMMLNPRDADLGGAPQHWLQGPSGQVSAGQPASQSRSSIPFDKCIVVSEYDARFGTTPADQGWTHGGAGLENNFTLIEGGVLQIQTVATLDSYWTKEEAPTTEPTSVFGYTMLLPNTEPYASEGDGFDFDARFRTATSAYVGVRYSHAAAHWQLTKLDGSADAVVVSDDDPPGWTSLAASHWLSAALDSAWLRGQAMRKASSFGSDGVAGALGTIAKFGDTGGGGTLGYLRNVVMSFGGRFIRPWFDAYTSVTAPTIRLHLVADANASVSKTARFMVRYGPISGSPYALPGTASSATVNFTTSNVIYEVPFVLSGLVANAPFWFTIERVWDHGDDLLDATVHFLHATVRSL